MSTMKWVLTLFTISIISCSTKQHNKNTASANPEINKNEISRNTIFIRDSISTKETVYEDLSYTNNFKITFKEQYRNSNRVDHKWIIEVFDKKKKAKIDSIVQPLFVYMPDLQDFSEKRSYVTGTNRNKEVVDNYYGDFVVADFNFDSKNDFAIINDIGGNGGSFYSFYIQQKDNKFKLDSFLTDSMVYFPTRFLVNKKTLVTYVHAGACLIGEHKYNLSALTNKWKEVSHRLIDVCKK